MSRLKDKTDLELIMSAQAEILQSVMQMDQVNREQGNALVAELKRRAHDQPEPPKENVPS